MASQIPSQPELAELLPGVPADNLVEVFSRIAWSVICEPGDGVAGMIVQTLGAANALENEINQISVQKIRAELLESGLSSDAVDKHDIFERALLASRERWRARLSLEATRAAIYKIDKVGGFVLTPLDKEWPSQLGDLEFHEPMVLWVRGNREALLRLEKSVAIVGCRGSSAYGEFATQAMAASLVEKGYSVVSGGAYGIDAHAHSSTLALKGNTVAVMAGGLDKFYPSGNQHLLTRISQACAVISELPPGSSPTKWRFLQRNRLIAALSQATLVVEANWRSGSMNTVSHAEKLNREVYAVPGPITSSKSAGTNKLIADQRAALVVDGKDFLERLGSAADSPSAVELSGLGAIEKRVLDAIGFSHLEISEICIEAGLTRDEARLGISNLELDGFIVRRGAGWVKTQTIV